MQPYELTAGEAGAAIRTKQLSPVELVDSVLARIEAVEGQVCAFVTVTADRARQDAARAAQEIAAGRYRGPLHGITVGVKDLVDTAGVLTTSSSRTMATNVPDSDAAVVERLAEAGAIMVGKTHTHEFAFGVTTPTTRNPWNLGHTPGGSSGGSGAALAAGTCQLAIGTDTGGSIRIPSALTGMVGLKPTYGRVSRRGIASLSWSLDHVGPMARTVTDVAAMLQALVGHDPADPASVDVPAVSYAADLEKGVAGLRLGLPRDFFFDNVDPEVEVAVRAAVQALADAGAEVVEVDVPVPRAYLACQYAIIMSEASAYHQKRLRARGHEFQDDVRLLVEAGEMILATDYIKALRARTLIQAGWRELFGATLDAVIAPTVPRLPARVGQDEFSTGSPESVADAYERLSAPGNLTGLPALSVPCGFSARGLPIGLQVIGRPFDEAMVLRVGRAWESLNPSAGRLPDLGAARTDPARPVGVVSD